MQWPTYEVTEEQQKKKKKKKTGKSGACGFYLRESSSKSVYELWIAHRRSSLHEKMKQNLLKVLFSFYMFD